MATFLQVAVNGAYTSGTWSGETAQCSWALAIGDENPTTTPVVNQDIVEFAYDDSAGSGSWAHGNFTRGFGGDLLTEDVQKSIAGALWQWATDCARFQVSTFQWHQVQMNLVQWNEAAVPSPKWQNKYETSRFNIVPKISGGATSPNLPPQCAITASHYTAGSGGRNRGRVYIPIHRADDLSGQLLGGTAIDRAHTLEDGLFDTLAAISVDAGAKFLTPAVVSREHRTYSTITDIRVGDEVDTQRRRRNFRAESYSVYAWPSA